MFIRLFNNGVFGDTGFQHERLWPVSLCLGQVYLFQPKRDSESEIEIQILRLTFTENVCCLVIGHTFKGVLPAFIWWGWAVVYL
jgi:hypothetical protein